MGVRNIPIAWQGASYQPVDSIDEAEPIAHGFFKWDGCAEIKMGAHTCSQKQWAWLLVRLSKLWGESAEQLAVPWEGFE
jgi:hypothetical protein